MKTFRNIAIAFGLAIILQIAGISFAAPFPTGVGGLGTSVTPASGTIPIGNGAGSYTPALITAGTNIVITNASGSITIAVNGSGFLPSSTVYVATVNGSSGAITITSSTLGVATNTLSLFNGNGFTTTTIQSVLNALSATGLLTYNSSTGAFGYSSSSLALGTASHYNLSDFLTSSPLYVASVNGSSGAVTITSSSLGVLPFSTTTINNTAGSTFRIIGDGTTVTSTVSGATTTFSILNTGNWAGTWQGINSSTFYLSSNPNGFTTTPPAGNNSTLQFNNNGSLNGATEFTYNTTTDQLMISGQPGTVYGNSFVIGGVLNIQAKSATGTIVVINNANGASQAQKTLIVNCNNAANTQDCGYFDAQGSGAALHAEGGGAATFAELLDDGQGDDNALLDMEQNDVTGTLGFGINLQDTNQSSSPIVVQDSAIGFGGVKVEINATGTGSSGFSTISNPASGSSSVDLYYGDSQGGSTGYQLELRDHTIDVFDVQAEGVGVISYTTTTLSSSTILSGTVSSTEKNALILAGGNSVWGAYGGASACAAGNAVTTISASGTTSCSPFLTSAPATTTVNGTQAASFSIIGDGSTATTTVNGATTTISVLEPAGFTHWIAPYFDSNANPLAQSSTPGNVYLEEFQVPFNNTNINGCSLLKASSVISASTTCGIYGPVALDSDTSASSTLIVSSTAQDGTTSGAPFIIPLATTTLNAGNYYVAVTYASSTDNYYRMANIFGVNGWTQSVAASTSFAQLGIFTVASTSNNANFMPIVYLRVANTNPNGN